MVLRSYARGGLRPLATAVLPYYLRLQIRAQQSGMRTFDIIVSVAFVTVILYAAATTAAQEILERTELQPAEEGPATR
jgi:hypothetical protein